MDYYWVEDSKGNLLRIPRDKIKDWDSDAELSEEEKQRIKEETARLFEETERMIKKEE